MASHAKPTPDERKSMPDAGTDEDILIPSLTASRISAPRRSCDWSIAAGTSRQGSYESTDQPSTHGCDRVRDVTLGP
jgi:hypothetical protein